MRKLLLEPGKNNRVLLWGDVIAGFDEAVENSNCFILTDCFFVYSKEYRRCCSYSWNVKNFGYLYCKSIIKNNCIFSLSCESDGIIFPRTKPEINISFELNYLNPAFFNSAKYVGISFFSFHQNLFFYRSRDENGFKKNLKQPKIVSLAEANYGYSIRYQLLPSNALRSFSRSSLEYPAQSMSFSLTKSSISHTEILHSSAALPMEILCSFNLSRVFCVFQDFIASANSLRTDSERSVRHVFSMLVNSFSVSLSSLTDIAVPIFVFNVIGCKQIYKSFALEAD